MKRGLIVYNASDANKNRWFIDKCAKELNSGEFSLLFLLEEDALEYINNHEIDYVIYRGRNHQIVESFEKKGIRVFNNALTNKTANNKLLTYVFAKDNGIASVESFTSFESIDKPFIMKSVSGHGGNEVFLINDASEIKRHLLENPGVTFIYQKYLDIDGDVRLYIIKNRFIAAVKRSNNKDYRSNFSLGGEVQLVEPPQSIIDVALKLSKLLNADFIGVDFFKIKDQYLLNEIEDPVGSRMLYKLTDIDIIHEFIEYIKKSLV